jgi:hypothetical protein
MDGASNTTLPHTGRGWIQHFPWTLLETVCALTILTFLVLVFQTSVRPSVDPREPPRINPKPPVIGHLIGLMKHHAMYFKML